MDTTQQTIQPQAAQDGQEAAMSRAYDHRAIEDRVYQQWLDNGYFTPPSDWTRRPWTLMMPPPNITGVLHHGHAMTVAFEDVMTRWRRMMGDNTLYLPGTDHASIATQAVVERELQKEGLTRHDLGREAFVERVWEWREHHGNAIELQLRKLGTSCDWSRLRFTLDDQLSRAVREAFVRLYHKGLIYRGPYLVNWCPRCGTVISNLEVVHEETEGELWTVRYDLDSGGHIEVATTRPETILGDTAVAVHPDDERYRNLVGHHAILPVLGRRIPIIADTAVDAAFGTGAVKVTPGHDPNDYELGQRHDLPAVSIMNDDASLNDEAGPYAGMDRYDAREALLRDLEAEQRIRDVTTHRHAVGTCDRCGTVVEPRISEQWFAKQTVLAQPAIQAVKDGRIKFVPQHFERTYLHWMENVHDWEISRQLWWGHRIPVWYCQQCSETIVPRPDEGDPERCPECSGAIEQDPDVLDTWFSSALWPFSTLGWPDQTEDLAYFYPTDVLETGYEIIFLWVSRMIMTGIEFMGEPPFHHVYLHGMIRHLDGSKISKSNPQPGDDPLDVIEEYGADALRYWIVTGSTPGQDVRLSLPKIADARNFANKLWNAARFVVLARDRNEATGANANGALANLGLAERWILSRCHATVAEVTRQMEAYQFGEAGRTLEEFLWGEFCDWYIELSKLSLYAGGQGPWQDVALDETTSIASRETALAVLSYVLDVSLRLLHPIM
ncbi:MAG: valine--tRNA ligase, partial [Dehalococcoidia bacterium]|nr:valine--tRNA ligase [Dehalococcoidia bacterium]